MLRESQSNVVRLVIQVPPPLGILGGVERGEGEGDQLTTPAIAAAALPIELRQRGESPSPNPHALHPLDEVNR